MNDNGIDFCLFCIFQIASEPISLKNLKRRSQFFEQGKPLSSQFMNFHGIIPPIHSLLIVCGPGHFTSSI